MTARPSPAKSYDLPHEEEVLQVLRDFGVKRAQLFGSAARGELTPTSDIDLRIEVDGEIRYGLLVELADALEPILGRKLDVMFDIHPYFLPYIKPDLVELPL